MSSNKDLTIGFAMTGSFCTFDKVLTELEKLHEKYENILPIMSQTAYETDTRFSSSEEIRKKVISICNREIIHTLPSAEPIGPKKLLDVLIIAPCTGNTLAKISLGITDSAVTLAAKAHLRNERSLIIAPSTNDGLGANAKNIGMLLNMKNVFFVPFGQDDPFKKHKSLVSDFSLIDASLAAALQGVQYQPIIISK